VALERARSRRDNSGRDELAGRLAAVLAELQRGLGYAQRMAVRGNGRIRFVPVEEIEWIEAADNYVRLHAGGERHLLQETMASVEARLDPAEFARIHRCALVNLAKIRELQPTFNGEYSVLLHSGARLTLSRGYRDAVFSRLGR
jgi:two-component system LytT family response regulator